MVAPLVAAAARAAAGKAAKSAARKTASRARKAGDVSTNARKRYYRASERYLKQAEKSSGTTAKRYRQLAKQNFEDALATYDPANTQKYSKPIQKLAAEFGYDLEKRRELPTDSAEAERTIERRRNKQQYVISESKYYKESALKDPGTRREREAQALFKSSEIGRRIIGGYVDVWRDEAVTVDETTGERKIDTRQIFKALFKYFDVDNLADLVEKVENEIGEVLYEMGNADEIYEVVKLSIQNKVLDNTLYE
jgi:hypothetical protein